MAFWDIGTSVYYAPGILYEAVGEAAPLFVLMTTMGFILLTLEYMEISWRNPGLPFRQYRAFTTWEAFSPGSIFILRSSPA